jgi:hypothetical protein
MYACVHETGRGFSGGVCALGDHGRISSDPRPTSSRFANDSILALCPVLLAAANLYSLLPYLVLAIRRNAVQLAVLCPHWGEAMQDIGYELLRIPLPRTPVNKGKKKVRSP